MWREHPKLRTLGRILTIRDSLWTWWTRSGINYYFLKREKAWNFCNLRSTGSQTLSKQPTVRCAAAQQWTPRYWASQQQPGRDSWQPIAFNQNLKSRRPARTYCSHKLILSHPSILNAPSHHFKLPHLFLNWWNVSVWRSTIERIDVWRWWRITLTRPAP